MNVHKMQKFNAGTCMMYAAGVPVVSIKHN